MPTMARSKETVDMSPRDGKSPKASILPNEVTIA